MTLRLSPALIASRYFCLKGERYICQHDMAKDYGFADSRAVISAHISGLFHYLDPVAFPVGKYPSRLAQGLKRQVTSARQAHQLSEQLENSVLLAIKEVKEIVPPGAEVYLPQKLPRSELGRFKQLLQAKYEGRLGQLHPKQTRAISLRFGLDPERRYRILEEVGALMGYTTRERPRQLIKKGLINLGLPPE